MDGGYTPVELLLTIPDILVRHLTAAGIDDAVVVVPERLGHTKDLAQVARAVILRLYPEPPPPPKFRTGRMRVPTEWLRAASAWVTADPQYAEDLTLTAMVEFPVLAADAHAVFESSRRAGHCILLGGDPDRRIRGAHGAFIGFEYLAVAGGGPTASDASLLETFDALVQLARRLAPAPAYAFVAVQPTFAMFSSLDYIEGPDPTSRRVRPEFVRRLSDQVVLDAYPYQLLGPGHMVRLETGRALLDAYEAARRADAGDGRMELRIGEPSQWLLDNSSIPSGSMTGVNLLRRDDSIQRTARSLLGPCLIDEDEARSMIAERWRGKAM